jgi:hypothetical protein
LLKQKGEKSQSSRLNNIMSNNKIEKKNNIKKETLKEIL